MSPAVEKILSLGTEVLGIARTHFANNAKWGYLSSLDFHQSNGLLSGAIHSSALNLHSSSSIWCWSEHPDPGTTEVINTSAKSSDMAVFLRGVESGAFNSSGLS